MKHVSIFIVYARVQWRESNCLQTEELVMPYLAIVADFRDSIRSLARQLKATDILRECDRLRDDILPSVGVRLEDQEGK
jgi:cysteinyl-tRNA synthetase